METRCYLVSRYLGEDTDEDAPIGVWESYEAALEFVDDDPYYHITALDYTGETNDN